MELEGRRKKRKTTRMVMDIAKGGHGESCCEMTADDPPVKGRVKSRRRTISKRMLTADPTSNIID